MQQGCNVPDIDLVVQWKLPGSISAFVQRAGRCARAPGTVGLAVLLVEPSVYSTVLDEHGSKPVGGKKSAKSGKACSIKHKPPTSEESKAKKTYAEQRGLKRGSQGGKHDAILVQDCPPIDGEATDEGLYSLVQAGTCRRSILSIVFGNAPARKFIASPQGLELTKNEYQSQQFHVATFVIHLCSIELVLEHHPKYLDRKRSSKVKSVTKLKPNFIPGGPPLRNEISNAHSSASTRCYQMA